MVVWTSYRPCGAGGLVRYIESRGKIFSRDGQELSDLEREEFIEKSEELNFERLFIFSPPDGKRMSDRDMSLYARRQMDMEFGNSPSCNYVYAVHRDTEHPHTMVAATGEKRDLRLYPNDLARMKENERSVLKEMDYELTPEFEKYFEREREEELELDPGGDYPGF